MPLEPNAYSPRWFQLFHVGIDDSRTDREAAFVCRSAPLPEFRNVVDVCCGMGRHARALASRGYSVTGIDRDADAITNAHKLGGGPTYLHADIRDYIPAAGALDVAIVMSQSFGHFDATTNRGVLRKLATSIRLGGRVVLDLWNEDFFRAHPGERELQSREGVVRETKCVADDRLYVHLDYPDGSQEEFEWQLYSPEKLSALAQSVGLHQSFSCTDFDRSTAPSPTKPRVQFVLERTSCGKG